MRTGECLGWLSCFFLLSACAGFQTAGQVQSGRRELLINNPEQALGYFQEVAQSNPNYIFQQELFREGIWTYVGRTQYATGRLQEARQSLERALSIYQDDYLARLYLGLTLARRGDHSSAVTASGTGVKGSAEGADHK